MVSLARLLDRFAKRELPQAGPTPGFIELRSDTSRLVVVPGAGGLVTSLVLAGREWLAPGGLAEYLPTIVGARVTLGDGTLEVPDGGELAGRRPEVVVETAVGDARATLRWPATRAGLRLERTIRVTEGGGAELTYSLTNAGPARTPFLWASLARIPLGPATRIALPEAVPIRVLAQDRVQLGGRSAQHWWPRCRIGEEDVVDLSMPGGNRRRYACRVMASLLTGGAAVEDGGARLEITFDAHELPNFLVEINKRTWAAGDREAPSELRLGPAIGLPDSLADAVNSWDGAHWLEPGERRGWSVTWSARPVV